MPRYVFACSVCRREFEVARPMSEAGRPATCPVDGAPADRVFTAPHTGVRAGGADPAAAPPGGAARAWASPFFPTQAKAPGAPAPAPRHVLPPGSSKPTRFRHFGHWHPAGTPAHTHAPRRPAPPPAGPPDG
jgi:putative FmdB family regulatory protein